MNIKFTDVDGNELALSDLNDTLNYAPTYMEGDFENKVFILDKFGIEGGYETGDSALGVRDASVKIYFIAQTDVAYRIRFARVLNFFKPAQKPFYLEDDDNNRRCRIAYKGMDYKMIEGSNLRIAQATIKLAMLDGLWEGDEITLTSANISSNGSFVIHTISANGIEIYNAYPIIKVTSRGANPDFSLTNTNNDDTIRIQQVALTSAQFIEMDSVDGIIRYGTVLSPTSKTGGNFIRFQAGQNSLLYQGSNSVGVDIEVRYRPRFVI